MVICADTSFLFSFYGSDSKTGDAVNWDARNQHPIIISGLNRFELFNALRSAECRRFIPAGQTMRYAAEGMVVPF